MSELRSEGECFYCGKTYGKRGISRHLESHLKATKPERNKKSFHLRVESGAYFLQLLMDGDAALGELDGFLRGVWLECCGHMSQFSLGKWGEEIPMNRKSRYVFGKGDKLEYTYDFGSSTHLTVKVISEHPLAVKEGVLLLSRNEPLEILCDHCKKEPAIELCSVHSWGDEEGYFCENCVEEHKKICADAEDYALLPLVNSPRMGVCAYTGGSIDLERD